MKEIKVGFESGAIEPIEELPFHEDDIEGSEEMKIYEAKECGLPIDAPWDEIAEKQDQMYISKLAVSLGLSKDASHEEVMAEEARLGIPNAGYFTALGVSLDASKEEIEKAVNEDKLKKRVLLKKIAEEIILNREKT